MSSGLSRRSEDELSEEEKRERRGEKERKKRRKEDEEEEEERQREEPRSEEDGEEEIEGDQYWEINTSGDKARSLRKEEVRDSDNEYSVVSQLDEKMRKHTETMGYDIFEVKIYGNGWNGKK
jgi:hypothetical protein